MVVSIIDHFTAKNPNNKSLWAKQNVLYLIHFVSIEQINKIKIFHMVASEHPEVIEGRRRLIVTDFIDPRDPDMDGSIDDDGDDLDEEDRSGSV